MRLNLVLHVLHSLLQARRAAPCNNWLPLRYRQLGPLDPVFQTPNPVCAGGAGQRLVEGLQQHFCVLKPPL